MTAAEYNCRVGLHDFWCQIAIAALMLFYMEPEEAVPLREHTTASAWAKSTSDFWWNWWLP